MKIMYKLLILMISMTVLSIGAFAQNDMSPALKNQQKVKVMPQATNPELQLQEAQEVAPTPEQMILQRMEEDGSINYVSKKNEGNSGPTDELCAPVFSSGCAVGDGFTDFAVEEIENYGNGCADNTGTTGWSQYFSLGPATLVPGFTHTFTMGTGYSSQHVNIWIDFNDDDVLDLDEMILYDYILTAAGTLYDVDVTIPANATPGEHKMRAMAVWITTFTDPCGSFSYGEAEDYMVNVIVPDYGNLEGFVTEYTGGAPVEGATVSVNGGMYTAVSGSDGYYSIDDVLVGTWPIECTKTGYNPAAGDVTIEVGITTQLDFWMTAPTMDIEPTAISITIDPFAQATEYIDISNNGDGALHWAAQLELLTEGSGTSKDAWDLQFSFDVNAASGAAGNAGAECDGEYYYSTRWASNLIHKYDLDGNLVEEFSIPGVTGLRDLAYDGTYFYGGNAGSTIYEMDFTNKVLVSSIASPQLVRSIAYDNTEDALWVANWATDITLVDKSGAQLNAFPASTHGLAGIYGTAFDDVSDGTPYLWIFDQGAGAGSPQLIHQANVSSMTMTGFSYDVLQDLGPDPAAIAGGLFLVDNVFAGTWSIGGMKQGTPDAIFMYELAPAGPVWVSIDPKNGDVDPGNMGQMAVHFDATDIVAGTIKTAEIHFTSDPAVGMVTVPVQMTVGNLDFGYVEGNVMLDGAAPYNNGEITEVLVEVGPYWGYPDENGDYSIQTYPGTYDVTATLYGYEQQVVTGIVVDEGVTVTGINFTMPCIKGKLYGTVTDEDGGAPIENAVITVLGTDFEAVTGADGTYEFFIEEGTYDVQADHPTYAVMIAEDVVINVEEDTEQNFVMTYQCIFCDASGGNDEYIDGVEFGTISNLGTGYQSGYANYTNLSTVVIPGMVYELTIYTGNMYTADDYGVWIDWNMDCTFDPSTENVVCAIDAGADVNVFDVTIPANAQPGLATMRVRLKYSGSDCGDPCGTTSWGEVEDYSIIITEGTYGNLEGTVTEQGGGPVEGAEINVANMYFATTGSDGTYEIMDVLTGTWDVTCTKEGYNPESDEVTIVEGQTATLDFELTAPGFSVEPTALSITLDPNATATEILTISNPGTGTVNWNASLNVSGEGGDDLFDVIMDVPVFGTGEAGIETDGTSIYTTLWAGTGQFQKYAMDGTWIETVDVSGAAAVRDMAYDGTHFYGGAASTTVFEMDLANATLVGSFTAPVACRAIAYNENDDAFYANNWSDNITKFSKSGANLGNFPVGPVGASYYGFAYDNYSGGEYLWGYAQTGATTNELIQIELPSGVETGLTFDVGSVVNVGTTGIAGGLGIDDHIQSGLWCFLGTSQGVSIWALELTEAQNWISIAPTSGTLNPGGTEEMDVMFDATGLLPGFYYADIEFSTNPNVGAPVVNVELEVAGLIPAINLVAMYNCTDVELSWEMPAGGDPDSWNVYRDGELIGSADDMFHTDEMVDPEVEYSYTVTAVYGSDESFPTPPVLMMVPVPDDLEPVDPDASHLGGGNILITWEAPEACLAPDEYNIYRDGSMVGSTTELEYTDQGLSVGFYEYYVVAVYYFGESGNSAPAYVLVGIGEASASEFQIFPNPATDMVNVKSDYHVVTIEVLNNAGQLVYSKDVESNNFQVNVSSYERGIYYFRMKTDDQVILRKVTLK